MNPLSLKGEVSESGMEYGSINFLSLREALPEPDENLFITAYPKGTFTRIKKTGNIFYEDSQYYAFSVNRSVLSGASGSPVLDEQGQIIGVVHAALNNFLYIIKVDYLREFIAGNVGMKCLDFDSDEDMEFSVARTCVREEIENLKELAEEESISVPFYSPRIFMMLSNLDIDQLFLWRKNSAEQNHALSQYSLGVMYSKGEGVDQDLDQAFQWMRRSAEQGYAPSQHILGAMYYKGNGVAQDRKQAFHWIRRSAEQSYAPAQHGLALMYFESEGVDQDLDQAFQWMRRSAGQGQIEAQYEQGDLISDGRGMNIIHRFIRLKIKKSIIYSFILYNQSSFFQKFHYSFNNSF